MTSGRPAQTRDITVRETAVRQTTVRDLADPARLLTVWEEALVALPAARTAVLLQLAGLTADLDGALDLTIGPCAALAARAHRAAFGPDIDGLVTCPHCGELLETRVRLPSCDDAAGGTPTADPGEARVGAYAVRAPTVRDLLAAASSQDGDARAVLLARCVRRLDGRSFDPAALTPAEEALVDEAAERLAGETDPVLRAVCPACAGGVVAALDVGAVLWDQIDAAAPALMAEVAALARAFGWSERAVLAMSPVRRQAYLTRVAAL
ncbi:hypothetical protein ACFV9D_24460 [Streptomyces sp. NPDC059875]|uniref:hypothetical protein n=1 Tax=unclassified Streptomyces TaxID=2593676 RepID=UPI00364E3B4D